MAKRTPPAGTNDDDDDDDEFTEKQLGTIGRLVNAAVTGTIERKLPAKIKEAVSGEFTTMRASLVDDLKAAMKPEGEPAAKPKEGERQAAAPTKDPEVESLRAKVAAMEASQKKAAQDSENAAKDEAIGRHLKAIGVPPTLTRGAIAVLRDSVRKTDNGYTVKAQRDGYEEDLDLAKGVKEWGDTDEGKSYRTAAQQRPQQRAVGSVNVIRGGGEGGGSKGKEAQAAAKTDAKQAALDKLGNAVNELTGGGGANIGMG